MRRLLLPAALLLGGGAAHAGLIAHYKFDETSGTTATDSSGSGNTGTLNGMTGSEWTTGKVGGALSFDGTNDYMSTASLYLNIVPYTISAFFKSDVSSGERSIVYTDRGGRFGNSIILGYGNGDNTIDVQYHNGWTDFAATYTANTWYHVAATYETGLISLYLDGVFIGNKAAGSAVGDGSTVGVGRHNSGDPQWFDGVIDEVRIYDHVLSAGEVSALAAMGGSTVPEPASVFASLGLLTAAGCGLREWRRRKKKV